MYFKNINQSDILSKKEYKGNTLIFDILTNSHLMTKIYKMAVIKDKNIT